ncbi:hypothetical protein CANINC_004038 [Pichia inconspicua]|uniref:Yippee domain-containing protein n=1 Tax=Pichia inconspicua TaxID=52247 RepID=A0A4T0WX59_9ASCO|nr:hypothetical protein CANINC_004038 [[Candida] inconspicua]
MDKKQQFTNPSRAVTRGNEFSITFTPNNDKGNVYRSSVSLVYGQSFSNSLKNLDWSKYSAAFESSTLLDLCGEESITNTLFSNSKSSSDVTVESSLIEIDDEKEEENGSLRIINEDDDEDYNWEENEEEQDEEEEEEEEQDEDAEKEENDEEEGEDDHVENSDNGYQDVEDSDDNQYESYFYKGVEAPKIYRCCMCYSDIFHSSHIISRDFWGSHGKAYFVKQVINTKECCEIKTTMRTGVYTIGLLSCAQCGDSIGWKYLDSMESSQSYKIDKYVIEEKSLKVFNFPFFDSIL